jgi:hypothetical protein
MKIPPKHSRARVILESLLVGPATISEGIARHSLLNRSEQTIHHLYAQLEVDQCLVKDGATYSVSRRARAFLVPPEVEEVEREPAAPAYRGDWKVGSLNAASARRSGAAFGINWIRS